MELEVEAVTGAPKGARALLRMTNRNGDRERGWETPAGRIELAIPKLRKGSYFPSFLEPRRTAKKALLAVIREAYVQGVSTRDVDELVRAMGGTGVSKSQVSRLCAESTSGRRRSWRGPSRGAGRISGSTPPTLKVRKSGLRHWA